MQKFRLFSLGLCIGICFTWFIYQMTPCHAYKQNVVSMHEYQMDVNWDSITIYDGPKTIGTVKLEGQLDSLIINDNL